MIDENTKNIIIESATFSLYNLRKTQMAHGIFSEAITRFTKGQPAHQTLAVAKQCAELLKDGFAVDGILDTGYQPEKNVVKITTHEINSLLGTNYSTNTIVDMLTNVGFKIETQSEQLKVIVPAWRTDIHIKEDIIEEIGRLGGYDNIIPTLPLHATAAQNSLFTFKEQIRNSLSAKNANEFLTYTFIHGDLMKKVGQDPANSYKIVNSISPELQYLRQSLAPSLLAKAYDNLKSGHSEFAAFELNQVFSREHPTDTDGVPAPKHHLSMVIVGTHTNYYLAKKYLETMMGEFGIGITLRQFNAQSASDTFYEPKRSASVYIGEQFIGQLGEIKSGVAHALKLPTNTAVFELDIEQILPYVQVKKPTSEISTFPIVSRDLTVTTSQPYGQVYRLICDLLSAEDLIFKVSPVSIYRPEGAARPSLSFHLEFSHRNKTLEAAEISALMVKLERAIMSL